MRKVVAGCDAVVNFHVLATGIVQSVDGSSEFIYVRALGVLGSEALLWLTFTGKYEVDGGTNLVWIT